MWVHNKKYGHIFWFVIDYWTPEEHVACVTSQSDEYELLIEYTPKMFTEDGEYGPA